MEAKSLSVPVQIAIAVVSWDDQFLIGQRGEGRELAGYWEFPGGKMHADETPAAAAERECLEETGLCVTAIDTYLDQVHEYDYGQLHLHFHSLPGRAVFGQPSPARPISLGGPRRFEEL